MNLSLSNWRREDRGGGDGAEKTLFDKNTRRDFFLFKREAGSNPQSDILTPQHTSRLPSLYPVFILIITLRGCRHAYLSLFYQIPKIAMTELVNWCFSPLSSVPSHLILFISSPPSSISSSRLSVGDLDDVGGNNTAHIISWNHS